MTRLIIKRNIQGQSFFEVVIAMALISIVLITLVGLASASISASVFSRNQTQAVRYTEQAAEWLSAEKSASWTNFLVHSRTSSWCLDSLYWLRSGGCTDSDFISGTNFKRSVNFTINADGSISADVATVWVDSRGSHSAPTSIIYTNGSTVTGVASSTPAPTPAWTFCSNEGSTCSFSGTKTVRYGSGTTYFTKTVTNSIGCNNTAFGGDPTRGVSKHCDYQ